MIRYDRKRSQKLIKSVELTFDSIAVHERAMNFYKFVYMLTKSKLAEKKFNEHKNAAIIECQAQLSLLSNEILLLDSLINNEKESE